MMRIAMTVVTILVIANCEPSWADNKHSSVPATNKTAAGKWIDLGASSGQFRKCRDLCVRLAARYKHDHGQESEALLHAADKYELARSALQSWIDAVNLGLHANAVNTQKALAADAAKKMADFITFTTKNDSNVKTVSMESSEKKGGFSWPEIKIDLGALISNTLNSVTDASTCAKAYFDEVFVRKTIEDLRMPPFKSIPADEDYVLTIVAPSQKMTSIATGELTTGMPITGSAKTEMFAMLAGSFSQSSEKSKLYLHVLKSSDPVYFRERELFQKQIASPLPTNRRSGTPGMHPFTD